MYDFLSDPIVSVIETDGSKCVVSLPEIYELAAADSIDSLPHLRAHQRPALHAFLVQLGCMACERRGREAPPETAQEWRELLGALTPEWPAGEPWKLVVDDWGKPAFLQPPQPHGAPPLKTEIADPDKLDLLVTSKNHDLKQRRMAEGTAEDWLFALLSLQTQEGFLGAGNYGVARMNGGFASRSYLTIAPEELRFGGRVFRDMQAILGDLDRFYESSAIGKPDGAALLWLQPWDGTRSLFPDRCHPLFIEVCRRVRFALIDGRILARTGGSKVARIAAKDLLGNIGDPWLPLNVEKDAKAMTLAGDGFSYRRMAQLLAGVGGRYELPYLAKATRAERNLSMAYEAYGLVRGQGKTEGFHSRRLVVPPKAVSWLQEREGRAKLAARSELFLGLAGGAGGKALRPALIQLLQGKAEIDWGKPSNGALCSRWLSKFEHQVDDAFFPTLFSTLDAADEDAAHEFSRLLADAAHAVLRQAAEAVPQHQQRQDLAEARAMLLLGRSLRKHLPTLRPVAEPTEEPKNELAH